MTLDNTADRRQTGEPEVFAEPGQQQQHTSGGNSTSNSTQKRPEQSQAPTKRSSIPRDATASTRSSQLTSGDNITSPPNAKAPAQASSDMPKKKQAGAASSGVGVLGKAARIIGLIQDSEQLTSADEAVLLTKIEELKQDNALMHRKLTNRQKKNAQLEDENEHLKQILQQAGLESEDRHRRFEEAIAGLKAELRQSSARAATLQRKVAEDGEKLSKAYTAAVSTIARDVSRDLPDDVVRNGLSTFFQGDFFSWCADMCVPRIEQQESAVQQLRSMGIINSGEEYLKAPEHLRFDMNQSDGRSSLVLLQAALANVLCDQFLTSPFFLARQQEALDAFEEELSRGDQTAAVDWRIQTVACLEAIAPFDPMASANYARQFEDSFAFLLQELDEEAREDLSKLFTNFAHLAIRLWKTRTRIAVFGMSKFAGIPFEVGSEHMEGETTVVSSLGRRLNGLPIGVVMRPLIISTPVVPDGRPPHQVVWSKALVWVTPHV